MKIAGKRKEQEIVFHASADKLREGAFFNDEMQKIGHKKGFIIKGVYHFKSHEEAYDHWLNSLIKSIKL